MPEDTMAAYYQYMSISLEEMARPKICNSSVVFLPYANNKFFCSSFTCVPLTLSTILTVPVLSVQLSTGSSYTVHDSLTLMP
jgi:hypothetical protein